MSRISVADSGLLQILTRSKAPVNWVVWPQDLGQPAAGGPGQDEPGPFALEVEGEIVGGQRQDR